ncbi:hypothetical protein [Halorubrum lipolyticum]|uniref:ParB/Sulfiredoxin domain-containing protein n=1 Tax=Halorubrum lipolyticum DSM 21995 TaxID=1227482 RepID=M0P2Z7_9EURY|nr:hypothetical protein [Halorubrum lipolyticum]EMA64456.1 hypothetical protein C469_00976 [Halorubrum lipolyticum DSM 21995]
MLGAIADVYADRGVEGTARLGSEYVLLRSPLASPLTKSAYWSVAPSYYRRQYPTDFDESAAAPDPFKIGSASPSRIRRFTRRCYPPWRNRDQLFGTVRDGDWDRRPHEAAPTYGGPPEELFHADTIAESPLYRALRARFLDGRQWTETRFIGEVISRLEDGAEYVWHDCRTRADVLDRCEKLEQIHRSMKRHGCLSYRERTAPRDRDGNFIDALEREIVVDVGRDGELLLTSGKHRLCIAKLLELDAVPVAFLVRHADWMRTRRAVADGDRPGTDHPDLRDISARPADGVSRHKAIA